MMEIETERLRLRSFEPTDFAAVHAYGSDPEVTRFMSFGPNTEEETRAFLDGAVLGAQHAAAEGLALHLTVAALEWAIILVDEGRLIGGCGMRPGLPASEEVELGYVLHRDFWRRGYGSEAARALRDLAFDRLEARRVFARIFPENAASIALVESLGFRREGVRRRDFFVRGKWEDAAVYAQLAEDPR